MKIKSVKIEKFRSIKKADIDLNSITAIVGENNAGKTAILRAINAVMNYSDEEYYFINKIHQYGARSNTYITMEFEELPEKSIYSDKLYENKIKIKFSYTYSQSRRRLVIIRGNETISIESSFLEELRKDIKYIYVPTKRTNEDIMWSDDSILKDLIIGYAAKYTENRDTISTPVRSATNKIHSTVLSKLENQIKLLYMQNKDIDFKIDFPSNLDYTALLDKIHIMLIDSGAEYLLSECGSGTQSLFIIAMHRANALLSENSIILGIEEPEINLHPQAQKRFILSLKQNMQNNETQALFTTHSTVLVDELNHDDIILVRREKDSIRGFISVVTQLATDFWTKYDVEAFKHYQFFNYRNSDFFFSKFVVLGESKNDCQVFEKLVEEQLMDKMPDMSFLDAGGVENIKYPYFLLKELKIPFVTIVDRDFFFPYVNDKLEDSRNDKGLPMYSPCLKNNDVINDIFRSESQKQELIERHMNSYRDFFSFIKNFGILSMNYCLEMDLTISSKARDVYYELGNVLPINQSQQYLLEKCFKSIKRIEKILLVLESIPKTNYPESYSKIKNEIISAASEVI